MHDVSCVANQEMFMRDTEVITFKAPRQHKKALKLVAADMETTPSELLRIAVEGLIQAYKDGFFVDYTARDDVQSVSDFDRAR